MFTETTVIAALSGLTAWRQNEDSNGIQLPSPATPTTGLYYQDMHPQLTLNNLVASAPDYVRMDAGTSAAKFATWLNNKTNAAITKAVHRWRDEKFATRSAKTLIERKMMYNGTGDGQADEKIAGKFYGHEFKPRRSQAIKMKLHKIGIQLSAAQSDVTIIIFRTDQPKTPTTVTLNYTTAGDVQWFEPASEIVLDGDGAYLIGYLVNDITGDPINGVKDYTLYSNGVYKFPMAKYYQASAISADSDGTELWDLQTTRYTDNTNYGLNYQVSVYCDYTDFISEQRALFGNYIRNAVAIDMLSHIVHNASHRTTRNAGTIDKDLIIFDINGDPQGKASGLKHDMEKAFNAITINYSQIDKICMPCKGTGVRIRTAR